MSKRKKELTKQDLRRQKRKQAQLQAFGILAAAIIGVLLVVSLIVFGVSKIVRKNATPEVVETPEVEEVVQVVEEPETEPEVEVVEEEPVTEEFAVSDNEIPEELSEAQKQTILDESIAAKLSGMTLEEKVAGLFFVTTDQLLGDKAVTEPLSTVNEALIKYPVGGIVLTKDNMVSESQVAALANGIRSMTNNEMFIAVSEPYGEDSPLVVSGVTEAVIAGQAEVGATGDGANAYTAGISVGNELSVCGINTVFGPVADIAFSESGYTSSRSYGNDPEKISELVRQMIKGIDDKDINVALRFFPGYGDVTSNPANTRPVSNRSKADIEEKDYPIYESAIRRDVEFVQVSQVAYKQITVDVPACLSSEVVTDMLRGDLNYEGIVVTDYMNNNSLIQHYKHADAAVMAIEAGCDMIFYPGNFQKAYNGILDAVNSGKISESRIDESLYRIYRVKYRNLINYDAYVGN